MIKLLHHRRHDPDPDPGPGQGPDHLKSPDLPISEEMQFPL